MFVHVCSAILNTTLLKECVSSTLVRVGSRGLGHEAAFGTQRCPAHTNGKVTEFALPDGDAQRFADRRLVGAG